MLVVALRKESVDRNPMTPFRQEPATVSLSARRAWIEIAQGRRISGRALSLSARRAWIEILIILYVFIGVLVALRKESVDRNTQRRDFKRLGLVALRKESVDRNIAGCQLPATEPPSLSARRAWIEICCPCRSPWLLAVALRKESVDRNKYVVQCRKMLGVALRKESVDRNCPGTNITLSIIVSLSARRAWIEMDWASVITAMTSSLSARRAWIEIAQLVNGGGLLSVALRKESVDRNC